MWELPVSPTYYKLLKIHNMFDDDRSDIMLKGLLIIMIIIAIISLVIWAISLLIKIM